MRNQIKQKIQQQKSEWLEFKCNRWMTTQMRRNQHKEMDIIIYWYLQNPRKTAT